MPVRIPGPPGWRAGIKPSGRTDLALVATLDGLRPPARSSPATRSSPRRSGCAGSSHATEIGPWRTVRLADAW